MRATINIQGALCATTWKAGDNWADITKMTEQYENLQLSIYGDSGQNVVTVSCHKYCHIFHLLVCVYFKTLGETE